MVKKAAFVALALIIAFMAVLPFLPVGWFHGHHTAVASSYTISGFESGHSWAKAAGTAGTWSDDPSKFTEGTQSYKLVTDGAGNDCKSRWTAISPAKDLTDKFLLIDVYIDNVANLDRLWLYAFSTAWTAGYTWKPSDAPSHYVQGNAQWLTISMSFTQAAVTGAPVRSSIVALQLYARDKNSTAVTVNFDNLRMTDKAASGVVSYTFDDGWLSQSSEAYSYMHGTYDYRATLYASYDVIGTDPTKYLDVAALTTMYGDGWDIGGHYSQNLDTVGDVNDVVSDGKDWQVANGFWSDGNDYAYPGGVWSSSITSIVDDYYASARTIIPYRETLPCAALYRLRVLEVANTTPVATIETAIDNAVTNSDWLILVFHKIVAVPVASIEYSIADFQTVVDYTAAKPATVKTVREVLATGAPTLTVNTPTSITGTTAALNGELTSDGGDPCNITLYWGTTNGGTNPASWANSGTPTYPTQPQSAATFYKCVASLTTATTYYFTARASNSYGATWATVTSFKTGNIFYCDYVNGIDATTATPLGWWSVPYTTGNGAEPQEGQTATGSTGSTAKVTVVTISGGTWAGGNAVGTLYWYGKSAAFAAETLTFAPTSATCSIGADFTYCAWKTITSGATTARIAPGDTIRIAKSPDPVSIGNAAWTDNSKTVTLAAAQTKTIDLCETAWTAVTGIISTVASAPTAGGLGYTPNDVLTITTGGTGGTVTVNTVNGGGAVLTVALTTRGRTYTTGAGKVTTGGTGDGNCTVNITAIADAAVTRNAVATDGKEGPYSMQVVAPAAAVNNACYAYYNIADDNYASYNNLSFWIKNSAAVVANNWLVCLCSDDFGVTPVDSFPVVAIPSTAQFLPLNIAKSGGGTLANPVKSIALWTGVTAPTNSSYLRLDDFVACTSTGLNLQSLISKNSLKQGGTEGWWAIQSISGTTVLLDMAANTKGNAGRGYSGTTDASAATYMREAIKTSLAVLSTTVVQDVMDEGLSYTVMLSFLGGFDTATNKQDADTLYDGLNGNGEGLRIFQRLNYTYLDHMSFFRYNNGLGHGYDSTNNNMGIIQDLNNNTLYGYNSKAGSSGGQTDMLFNSIVNANSNGTFGIYLDGGTRYTITSVTNLNCNGSSGIYFANSGNNNTIGTISHIDNNASSGVVFSQSFGNTLGHIGTINYSGSTGVGFINYPGNNHFLDIDQISHSTQYGIQMGGGGNEWFDNIDDMHGNGFSGIYLSNCGTMYIGNASITSNTTYAIQALQGDVVVFGSLTTSGNTSGAIYSSGGNTFLLNNASLAEGTEVAWNNSSYYQGDRVYSTNHDLGGSNKLFVEGTGSYVISQTATRYNAGAGMAWKFSADVNRTSYYPVSMPIARVYLTSGVNTTVSVWVKKDNGADIGASLFCKGGQISGIVSDLSTPHDSTTAWELLSINLLASASGAVEIEGRAWYVSGASFAYFDTTFSVTTASASDIGTTTATMSGTLSRLQEYTLFLGNVVRPNTVVGFAYDTDSGTPYANTVSESGAFAGGVFSDSVTSLSKGELYYYAAYSTSIYGTLYGAEAIFLTKPDAPSGLSATSIDETQIDLAWTKGDGAQKTKVRAKLGSAPTSVSDGTQIYFDTGTSCSHAGLTTSQHWYYRVWSYATEGGLVQYSDLSVIDSATTGLTLVAPVVGTLGSASVEETTATLFGNVTHDGNLDITTRGFEYDTDGAPYDFHWSEGGIFGEGPYAGGVTGLSQGYMYYYRAYATNAEGTTYGTLLTFLTKPDPPTDLVATPTTAILYTLDWLPGAGATSTIIRGKIGFLPTDVLDGILVYDGPGVTCTHDVAGEHWYYRAWSYASAGIWLQYSDETAIDSCEYCGGGGLPAVPDEPTNFTATYNSDNLSVYLSWVLGVDSDDTLIQGSLTTYPATPTDGATVYYGPADNCTDSLDWAIIEDGGMVYYSAWGVNAGGLSVDYATANTGGGTGMVDALIMFPLMGILAGLSVFGDLRRNWLVILVATFGWFLLAGWSMSVSSTPWDAYWIIAIIAVMLALITAIWPVVSHPEQLPKEEEISEEEKAWGGKGKRPPPRPKRWQGR